MQLKFIPAKKRSADFCDSANISGMMLAIDSDYSILDLSNQALSERSGKELAALFASIPAHIDTLSLSNNQLHQMDPQELAQAFLAIPETVKTLNLSRNHFFYLNFNIAPLKNTLPFVQTLYIRQGEDISDEKNLLFCQQFGKIFPSLQAVVLTTLQNEWAAIGDARASANLSRALGLVSEVPSLQKHCSFFIHQELREKRANVNELPLSSGMLDAIKNLDQLAVMDTPGHHPFKRKESCNDNSVNTLFKIKPALLNAFALETVLNDRENPEKIIDFFQKQYQEIPNCPTELEAWIGLSKTDAWSKAVKQLRIKALSSLESFLLREQDPQIRLQLLNYALNQPLFKTHRSNYFFSGAFGDTASLAYLKKCQRLIENEIHLAGTVLA